MKNRQIKRVLVILSMLSLVFILTACGTGPVTQNSTGFWDRYVVYTAGQFVIWLANLFGGNPGVGIIAFTLIIRILIFPLSYMSIKSMSKQQEIAPQLNELKRSTVQRTRKLRHDCVMKHRNFMLQLGLTQ